MKNLIVLLAFVFLFLFSDDAKKKMKKNKIELPKIEMKISNVNKKAEKPFTLIFVAFVLALGVRAIVKK